MASLNYFSATLNKNFRGHGQPAKFLPHVASTWRQDVWFVFEERRHNFVCYNWPSSASVFKRSGKVTP